MRRRDGQRCGPGSDGVVARDPVRYVGASNVQSYAQDRVAAAQAFPKKDLIYRLFRLPQLDLIVWFASQELAELCERKLFQRRDLSPASARAEIYVLDSRVAGWTTPVAWFEKSGLSPRSLDQSLAAIGLRGYYYHDSPSWQFFDPLANVGVMTLSSPLGLPPWEISSPLRLFIHWAYAAAGMRLIHAATLGLGSEGALISGASGSGKSGTTLAGLLNGLDSNGDDYVVVEAGVPTIAYPVFKLFKQDPEGLRRVGLSSCEMGPLNWQGKIEFDAEGCAGKSLAESLKIRAILIPVVARLSRSSIERADARSAALSLAPSGVFQLPGDAASGFQFIAALVRAVPAFRLMLSEDPADIAATVHAFLLKESPNAR